MDSQLEKEDILIQIRDKLRRDGVKLWVAPYYAEITGPSLDDLKGLSRDYSNDLAISVEKCYETILELQHNALENLKQNNRYKESGLATIKIKVLHQNSPPRVLTKELLLSSFVQDVKNLITKEVNIPSDRLKLINSGKVLNDSDNLGCQGVKNGQQILAISLVETPTEVQENEQQIKELEATKTDSRLLADDNEYMQLEDQFGNAVKVPKEEKKSLIVAMALHERGRAALKRNDFSKALIFFLEADEEFKRCNSQLLGSVDNYALLDLDVAWCYLNLQSVAHLPEAHDRLKRCEERFHKSYGPNLERLIAVKGAAGNESVLFMRLHLLQAIVLYHRNMRKEALELLRKAQQELSTLKVDENSVLMLVQLGFTLTEARLGLRVTQGDINQAANYINENRDKRKQSRKKALAEEIYRKNQKKLGKCDDGKQYVDPNFVKILVNMGYNKEAARVALKTSNNVISDSIQYIQEHPQAGPSQSKSLEFLSLINDFVPELQAAGFDPEMAKLALHKHGGDIMKAVDELLANGGVVDGDLSDLNLEELLEQNKKKKEEKDEAFKRLAEDITMVDDDHLDLTLTQEEIFLNQYLALLDNNK